MDLRLASTADADDRSESINEIVRRVDNNHGSTGHLLQLLSNFPASQSTITTESQWRPPSEAERRSTGVAGVLPQTRKRHEEYESFKERFNRLKRKDVGPAVTDDFSLRRRRDTRHQSQQNFDDTLTVITYNTNTNFTDFSSQKTQQTFGSRLNQARDAAYIDSWYRSRLSTKTQDRLQVDELALSRQDQTSSIFYPHTAPKQSTQGSPSRPDIKGKGRMIRSPSPADKGQDRPTQTSPAQQQFLDDNIDDFELDYGNDDYSTRSPRQLDAKQRDVTQENEQNSYHIDNDLVDYPFEEDIAGGDHESQTAGPSNIERNERIHNQSDDDLMDLDDTSTSEIIRAPNGKTFAARLIEEMKNDGSVDMAEAYRTKYGPPSLSRTNIKKLFEMNSNLKPMAVTGKPLQEVTELFLDQIVDDLVAYSDHAGSQSVTMKDVRLLMARQGLLKEKSVEALAHQYLSREHWDKVCVSALAYNLPYPRKDLY